MTMQTAQPAEFFGRDPFSRCAVRRRMLILIRSFENLLVANLARLRRPVCSSPMKFLRAFAALPLFTVGLWAADSMDHGIPTPEAMFPQLDGILSQAVAQSPTMLARAIDQE